MLPYLMDLHAKGQFHLNRFVSFYPINEYETAFKDIKDGKALKAVLL